MLPALTGLWALGERPLRPGQLSLPSCPLPAAPRPARSQRGSARSARPTPARVPLCVPNRAPLAARPSLLSPLVLPRRLELSAPRLEAAAWQTELGLGERNGVHHLLKGLSPEKGCWVGMRGAATKGAGDWPRPGGPQGSAPVLICAYSGFHLEIRAKNRVESCGSHSAQR